MVLWYYTVPVQTGPTGSIVRYFEDKIIFGELILSIVDDNVYCYNNHNQKPTSTEFSFDSSGE